MLELVAVVEELPLLPYKPVEGGLDKPYGQGFAGVIYFKFCLGHELLVRLCKKFGVDHLRFFNEAAVDIVLTYLELHSEKLLAYVVCEFENDVFFFRALVLENYVFAQCHNAVLRGVLDFFDIIIRTHIQAHLRFLLWRFFF